MLKRIDPFTLIGIFIIGIPLLAATLTACAGVGQVPTVPDPEAKVFVAGQVQIREIHPKPGVTCFVYKTYGISCIKD